MTRESDRELLIRICYSAAPLVRHPHISREMLQAFLAERVVKPIAKQLEDEPDEMGP